MVNQLAPAHATEASIWAALADVPDPEIPAISIVDLGIVRSVTVRREGFAEAPAGDEREDIGVELLPTFVGCPALEAIREAVAARIGAKFPGAQVAVAFSHAVPWTTDRISPRGREQLRKSGFAPPVGISDEPHNGSAVPAPLPSVPLLHVLPQATCPYCGSRRTRLTSAFGPTLCRAIYHCADCRQPFEQFKTV